MVNIHHFGLPSTLLMLLLTVFVLSLLFRKTRTVAVILLCSVLALALFGIFGYHISSVSPQEANRTVQFDLPQPAVQISQTSDGNSTISVSAPNVQIEDQIAGQPASEWAKDSQISPTYPVATHSSLEPTWFAFGLLAILGLLLLGGLAFTIAMISIPKTRTLGIVLLVVGSILILPIVAGLFWFESYSPVPTVPYPGTQPAWPTSNQPPGSEIPLPPGYTAQAPMLQPSQSQPDNTPQPNSKQIVQAYESAIQYYCKAIAQPLKLEKPEILSEKVSTLDINFQDLGHVTISGSSFLINSIGQALAKAMTEKMKEGNPQIDITSENSTTVAQEAASPANNISEQPALAGASLKKEIPAKESPVKDASAETAKAPAPAANALESAAKVKAVSAETKNVANAPERPDWIGKKPFSWRAGKGAELPDYYKIVNPKPVDGDAYVMSVSTDPYTTMQECETKIPEVIQSAVDQFAEKYLRRNWGEYVQLSPDQLRQLVVAEYEETKDFSFGKMTQVHLLLNFDQKAKTLINDALNLRLFNNRSAVAGIGFIGLWLLLAVFWSYLKLDLSTKGAYRRRLRAAAGFAILIIVTMGFLVLRSLA
jgi:hypothetical protein